MYDVRLAGPARRCFEEADAPLQRKLDRCFDVLRNDPRRHGNIKALRGDLANLWRFRVGDYRVIYSIDEVRQRVNVLTIVHRRDAY